MGVMNEDEHNRLEGIMNYVSHNSRITQTGITGEKVGLSHEFEVFQKYSVLKSKLTTQIVQNIDCIKKLLAGHKKSVLLPQAQKLWEDVKGYYKDVEQIELQIYELIVNCQRQLQFRYASVTPNGKRIIEDHAPSSSLNKRSRKSEKEYRSKESKDVKPVIVEPIVPTPIYCICRQGEYGIMIGCDMNEKCRLEWYHLGCVGLQVAPPGDWYCNECIMKFKLIKTEPNNVAILPNQEVPFEIKKEKDIYCKVKKEKDIYSKVKNDEDIYSKVKKEKDIYSKVKKEKDIYSKAKKEKDIYSKVKKENDIYSKVKKEKEICTEVKKEICTESKKKEVNKEVSTKVKIEISDNFKKEIPAKAKNQSSSKSQKQISTKVKEDEIPTKAKKEISTKVKKEVSTRAKGSRFLYSLW